MTTSDQIAALALIVAIAAAVIAAFALREARRTNRIALLGKRTEVYQAFKTLSTEALCAGFRLSQSAVDAFETHAENAQLVLPRELSEAITSFYKDCETVAWIQTVQQPVDQAYQQRAEAAAERIRLTAIQLQESFRAELRCATAA